MRMKLLWIAPVILGLSGCTYFNNLFEKQQAPAPVYNQGQDMRFYTVQSGDTLFSVAKRFNVTERTLILWNNLQAPYNLQVGEQLRVRPNPCEVVYRADGSAVPLPAHCQNTANNTQAPASATVSSSTISSQPVSNGSNSPIPRSAPVAPTTSSSTAAAPTPVNITRTANARGIYTVQTGDTLAAIANSFGVTVSDMMVWNNLSNANHIWVGQRLRVVAPEGQTTAATPVVTVAPTVQASPQPSLAPRAAQPTVQPAAQPVAPQPSPQPASQPTPAPTATVASASGVPSGKVVNGLQWRWPLSQRGNFTLSSVNSDGQIGTTSGANALAAADGTVLYSGVGTGGYGQMVIINHGDGYISAYMNLSRATANENQAIKAGTSVGQVGRFRGESNLGFEIRLNGNTQPLGNFYNL